MVLKRTVTRRIRTVGIAGLLTLSSSGAFASSFALIEQSVSGMGSAYAIGSAGIDDASTIRVDTAWAPVTSSEMLSQSVIWQTATVHNLLGPDGAMYGYLVYATGDSVSFKQVDQQSMRLFYQPARREKGPQY